MPTANLITSIVLYHHTQAEIQPILDKLLATPSTTKIVLVDNEGCDWANTLNHPKIAYIKSSKNGGFGHGHNQAIHAFATQSDLFLICNPDVDFAPSALENLIQIAQSRPEGLFSPKVLYPDNSNQYGQRLLPTPLNLFARRFAPAWADKLDITYLLKNANFTTPTAIPALTGCFMLFKSEALLALGGFDERYFMYMEDIDLSRRCAVQFGACYVPTVTIYHEHAQASYKNPTLLKAHIKSVLQYFNKWGWVFDGERKRLNQQVLEKITP